MSRHFLLDGYNILRQMPGTDELSLEDGRAKLIRFVRDRQPQGSPRNAITIVFDGQEGVCSFDFLGQSGVIFSKGETADDLIKRMVEESSAPRDIVLVTDDRDLLYFCRTQGAEIWSVARFLAHGEKAAQKAGTGIAPRGTSGNDGKTIPKVFEDRVNRELKDVWLKGKK